MGHLEIKGLSVTYGTNTVNEVRALIDVHLSIGRGEIVFVLGPNGSGKTTLMKALMGECSYKGELVLKGRRLEGLKTHERAKLITYWPQHVESVLPDSLTLIEVFSVGARRALGKRLTLVPPETRQRAWSLIDEHELPLTGKLDDLVSNLSGGQMSAALFLIAFGGPCNLILLDEPTGALDDKHRSELEEYIVRKARLNEDTVLWITQDLDTALDVADRILVLGEGKVKANLKPSDTAWNSSFLKEAFRGD